VTWETRDVLLIVGAVASAAATIITVRHTVAALSKDLERTAAELRESIKGLTESRDKLGARLGRLERTQAINAAVARVTGTPVLGTPVPRAIKDNDDSGDSEG